jgi:hypothetical protein
MKPLSPTVERAICRDYVARRGRKWTHTTDQIAERHKVTQWTVNLVRLRNGLWRNDSCAVPQTAQLREALKRGKKANRAESATPKPVGPVPTMFRCDCCGGVSLDVQRHPRCGEAA